ncbi:retinoschisin-like [Antedon mediterranea]|uniref:retinoschisin-like n=1 Tax=Antedon mediterranea TaxID=105859 RepID=UPI003AF93E4F
MFTSTVLVFVVYSLMLQSSTAAKCTEYNIGLDVDNLNTYITDSAFTSSSQATYGYRASRGRLNTRYEGSSDKKGGWMASSSDDNPWIEVDLQGDYSLTGITTQGRQCGNNWVTKFQVQYKKDGDNNYFDSSGTNTAQTFDGNSDRNTEVTNSFPKLTARYIRILPTDWYGSGASLRFDLIACD